MKIKVKIPHRDSHISLCVSDIPWWAICLVLMLAGVLIALKTNLVHL